MCITNDNNIIYSSWDMNHVRQNFLSSWTIFCPFTLLTSQKIKILKKWKKHLEILSFYTCAPEVHQKWKSYDVWFLRYGVQQAEFLSFLGHFLPFTPLTIWKIKISTKKKIPGYIIILHVCSINENHMYGS